MWDHINSIFEDTPELKPELHDDEIEIAIRAFDIEQYPAETEGYVEGNAYQMSGIVTLIGSGAKANNLGIGDRVTGLANGPFTNLIRVSRTSIVKLSNCIPFTEAYCSGNSLSCRYQPRDAEERRQGSSTSGNGLY